MEEMKKEFAEDTPVADEDGIAQSDIESDVDVSEETTDSADEQKCSKQEKKKIKKLEAQIEQLNKAAAELETQIAEANDKYTRLFAEYDNYRKRSLKEREGIYTDAYVDAVTEILPILDNMERALQYKDNDSENISRGLEMIMKSFIDTLAKMGVSEIEAMGAAFDPNLHNAVMHVDDEAYGENEIVEVFMKGYVKGDKVLRHSMVKVAN